MPKVVDHEARRVDLVRATWRIVAREGLARATMRSIAEEAGFANGALKPYFASKSDLLAYAFGYVFDQTNARIREAVSGHRGIAALRAFGSEVLPLDEERLDEARIVLPFWQEALHDPLRAQVHAASMQQWRSALLTHLGEAAADGELRAGVDADRAAGSLLNFLLGAQVSAALMPADAGPRALAGQLEDWLAALTLGED
ncbi:TetR/AcrR family transcriptional regulator [Arthrobacter koreensis]|uniref:TetR/AcrR family transcriptional regulator n=1 Tax=Arthrobacter koreensis TaxID=199136 RepID=UPI002DC27BB5|nr:TetR/AcrR family transcriptional regulator [Arthrobacter koreensis]